MKLPRLTPAQTFDIRERRYRDNTVLLANYKIGSHNLVTFTKDSTLKGQTYYVDGKTAMKYPVESNGKIAVRSVPMDEFQLYEGREDA